MDSKIEKEPIYVLTLDDVQGCPTLALGVLVCVHRSIAFDVDQSSVCIQ